ncbi:MAG: metallophosphoesterase family protein [Candidatus Omnitrophota bacterium]|nr:metallophosphoesterase family protein [Candidatus Omnitrophota bacterium]
MKIGVIADTHIPVSAARLPQKVYDYFKDCDLIIHAGDVVEMSVIEELSKLAETKAVQGNMDSPELKRRFPEKMVIDAGGKTIGVIHGRGPSFRVKRMVGASFSKKPDIIIFGHSHSPVNEKINGTLFFNPGTPTDRVFARYRSFGIIEVDGDDVRGEIIEVDD